MTNLRKGRPYEREQNHGNFQSQISLRHPGVDPSAAGLADPRERHLANVNQLTNEGENAEVYFSPDGKKLIFQRTTKSDGKKIVFCSNRNAAKQGDTNVFIADWVEQEGGS
jgi:WD40 repeat protein